MIIRALHIEKFGKWNGLRLQNLEAGVNLFYGPNETGKTTLMQFIRSVFYGFPAERLAYAFREAPEKTGGSLCVQTPMGELNVRRLLVPHSFSDSVSGTLGEFGGRSVPEELRQEAETARANGARTNGARANGARANGAGADLASRAESLSEMERTAAFQGSELPFFAQDGFQRLYLTRNITDGLSITDADGVHQDSFHWRNLLELSADPRDGENGARLELDEKLFNSIFALGLQELQQLAVLDSTEAARRLYDLSTGMARYSLVNILAKLSATRQMLLAPNGIPERLRPEELQRCDEFFASPFFRAQSNSGRKQPTELLSLWNYRQILLRQQENLQTQNRQYGKIHAELMALEAKESELQETIRQKKHRLRILETAQEIQEEWETRTQIDAEIVEFNAEDPELGEFSDSGIEQLGEGRTKLKKIRQEMADLRKERDGLNAQIQEIQDRKCQISFDPELIQKASVLETFFQQQEWIETLRGRLADLYRQQMDSEAQLAIDYRRLGIQLPNFDSCCSVEEAFPYDARALRPLRGPLREMHSLRKKIREIRKLRAELLGQAENFSEKVREYARLCEERTERLPKVRQLPGMSAFPKNFLLTEMAHEEILRASAVGETVRALRAMNAGAMNAGAMNARELNSRVVSEIPEEILDLKSANSVPQKIEASSQENAQNQDGEAFGLEPEMASSANSAGLMDVNAAARLLGEVLATLRRTELHHQQLTQAVKSLEETQNTQNETLRKQYMTPQELGLFGSLFSLGLGLALFELFFLLGFWGGEGSGVHFFFFLLGMAAFLGVLLWRFTFTRKLGEELEAGRKKIENAQRQKDRFLRLCFADRETEIAELSETEFDELCRQEREELEKLSTFLEKELAESEKAAKAFAQRTAMLAEARQYSARLKKLNRDLTEVKTRWREGLKELGLPETWRSENVRQLVDASDRIREMWRRRNRDQEDFQLYAQELQLLVNRLETILPYFGDDFAKTLRGGEERFPFAENVFGEMQMKLRDEQERERRVHEMDAEIAELQTQIRNLRREYEKRSRAKTRILEEAGAADEKRLDERLEKLERLREMRNRRRVCQKAIDAAVGFTCTESMLWEVYETHTAEQLTEKKNVLENALSEEEFQLASAQKRAAECRVLLQNMISDDSPARIRFELAETESRIAHTVNSWRVCAMSERLLETIRKTYQQKRQPRTLELASGYLEEMTEGKYVRVWTPVDEDLLFVQQKNGTVFSTEQLSMGTRELLYLAIRLALIEEYRQRNVRLPIILDDVLVNFDRRRATAAARLLTKFAGEETQIFFFTSHEHVREIFIQEDALICDMEKRK